MSSNYYSSEMGPEPTPSEPHLSCFLLLTESYSPSPTGGYRFLIEQESSLQEGQLLLGAPSALGSLLMAFRHIYNGCFPICLPHEHVSCLRTGAGPCLLSLSPQSTS